MKKALKRYLFALALILLGVNMQVWAAASKHNPVSSLKTLKASTSFYHKKNVRQVCEETPVHPAWYGATKHQHARFVSIFEAEEEDETSSHKKHSLKKNITASSPHTCADQRYSGANATLHNAYRHFAYSTSARYIVFRVFRI